MVNKSISVFFPALNEEENIEFCINSAKRYLKKHFPLFEIIVVSNGSSDNTEEIVKKHSKIDKRIKSVHQNKLGYGLALRSGFENCNYDLIFYMDSDNQFAIEDLDNLLPFINKYDIVSGYRIKRQDPLMRIFIANVYNLLIRLIFNLNIRDIDASFKLYKSKVLKNIKLKSKTGLIDAEVLIKARKKGFLIKQVGVRHYPRLKGQTSYEMGHRNKIFAFVRPKVIIDILKEIKTLRIDLR